MMLIKPKRVRDDTHKLKLASAELSNIVNRMNAWRKKYKLPELTSDRVLEALKYSEQRRAGKVPENPLHEAILNAFDDVVSHMRSRKPSDFERHKKD